MAPKSAGSVQFSGNPPSSAALNSTLSKLFLEAYLRLCYTVKDLMPCQVLGVSHFVNIVEDGVVEVLVSAMVRQLVHKICVEWVPFSYFVSIFCFNLFDSGAQVIAEVAAFQTPHTHDCARECAGVPRQACSRQCQPDPALPADTALQGRRFHAPRDHLR